MEIAVEGDSFTPETQNNACVGIIGGADGPTVIMTGEKSQGRLYAACSALHFEPVRDDVEWCTMQALGVDIQTIQSIVGHADTEMTEHYLHVQESIRQSAIQLFNEAFSA